MRSFVYNYGQFAPFADLKCTSFFLFTRALADISDFGYYPLLDILTVVPVQLVFADRSVKINNRNIFITIVNYGFM
jgi:hypothetical protein